MAQPETTSLPSTTWRTLAYPQAGERLPKGLDAAWVAASRYTAITTVAPAVYAIHSAGNAIR